MPMWRCPHCGTPQAETARCWVCRRSSTACGTCRNFRRSVAGSLGYCGLDRRRQPLVGDEIRECWEARTPLAGPSPAVTTPPTEADERQAAGRVMPLEFIEVHGRLPSAPAGPSATAPEPAAPTVDPTAPSPDEPPFVQPPMPREPGWSLWGDLDR